MKLQSILSVAVCTFVALCAAPLAHARETKAEGFLRVESEGSESADVAAVAMQARAHAVLLRGRPFLEAAVTDEHSELRKTAWFGSFASADAAVEWLSISLRAEAVPETNLIRVALEPAQPINDGPTVLTMLVDRYLAQAAEADKVRAMGRMQTLVNLKTKYEQRLSELKSRHDTLLVRMDVLNGSDGSPQTPAQVEVDAALRRRIELYAQVANGEGNPVAAKALELLDRRIEALRAVLGDVAIQSSELQGLRREIADVQSRLAEMRSQIALAEASPIAPPLTWAMKPAPAGAK